MKSTVSQDFSQQLVMARRKLDKTLADYLAIAVTPALIMVLIGSLVWFLAEIGYTGSRESRVRWILFWFVVGAVLVARIAMEQGRAQASIFLLGLAGATSLAIFKFASDGPLVPIICLGIVAWCADKLTWDCTLIDESEDASGEGLLQVAGVADEAELPAEYAGTDGSGNDSGQRDSGPRDSGDSADSGDGPDAGDGEGASGSSASAAASARGTPGRRQEKVPFWRRVFLNESERAGKPHAPGLWVVYFSLAALPIFGFGQTMIPETRPDSRHFAFRCLLAYVGAGLGLLMLTSFLGLRRYLRQRNLEMPPTMAATWVGMGAAIATGILLIAILLPRPQGDYSITEVVDAASVEVQEAADWALLNDDGGQGDGQRSGPADENAEEGSASDPGKKGEPGGNRGDRQGAQNDGQNRRNEEGNSGSDQQGQSRSSGQSGKQQGESSGQSGQKTGQKGQSGGESGQRGQNSGSSRKSGNESGQNRNAQQNADGKPDRSSDRRQDDDQQDNGRQTGDQQRNGQQSSGRQNDGGQESGSQDEQAGEQTDAAADEQGVDEESADEESADEQPADEESAQAETDTAETPPPSEPSSESSWMESLAGSIGTIFKWLIYAAMIAAAIYVAIRNGPAIAGFFQRLWAEFLSLFGRRPEDAATGAVEPDEPAVPPRPFSAFRDPFRSGAAAQHSPAELVRYTFEALQAWAFENGCPRTPDQTPIEFGQQLQARKLSISSEAREVSDLYAQVAYAGLRPDDSSMAALRKLWQKLS